ncbi:MAG: PcfJ domain-containing protein [Planctomycetota bacterium]
MQAPDDATPAQAFRWAQVMATADQLNASISQHLARQLMLTMPMHDGADEDRFWRESVRFFVRNPISGDELETTVATIAALRFTSASVLFPGCDSLHPVVPELSIANRTLRSVRRLVANWREDFDPDQGSTPRKHCQWPASVIPAIEVTCGAKGCANKSEVKWQIVQLRSARELRIEGRILKHCVGRWGYDQLCVRGRSSIWSLRRWSQGQMRRAVTIELLPSRFVISQAKGKANRPPTPEEAAIIRKWAAQNHLRIGEHVCV